MRRLKAEIQGIKVAIRAGFMGRPPEMDDEPVSKKKSGKTKTVKNLS
jgi:hypothetical protein